MKQTLILLVLSASLQAASFRDDEGWLQLDDCQAAKAWRASGEKAQTMDATRLLNAAYLCAKDGQRDEALALQMMVEALPNQEILFGVNTNFSGKAKISLALGETTQASQVLRTSSERLLDHWNELEDPLRYMHLAQAMQRLNDKLASALRATDPSAAATHQLLSARAFDLAEVGEPVSAALHYTLALTIAAESKDPKLLAFASNTVLDHHADALALQHITGISSAISQLSELGRKTDALALAKRLRASGSPEAIHHAEPLIKDLER